MMLSRYFNQFLQFISNTQSMKTSMIDFRDRILKISRMKHVKYGLPFVLFIVGGSFGLREVTSLRYEYRDVHQYEEKMEDLGLEKRPKEEITLEAQYEKIKEIDTENWENVRVYRPWEDETVKEEGETAKS